MRSSLACGVEDPANTRTEEDVKAPCSPSIGPGGRCGPGGASGEDERDIDVETTGAGAGGDGSEGDSTDTSRESTGELALGSAPIPTEKGKLLGSMKSPPMDLEFRSSEAEFCTGPACSKERSVRREPLPNKLEELSSPKLM